ncbi:hypothetical protein [Falsibacillus albus]|uniref:hypothetical protein n=1 Tax=Falsibacillus albus TaxID=2478915 RepID=UPI0011E5B6FE|nr:hypothetical protein [Falsibacillus albus]
MLKVTNNGPVSTAAHENPLSSSAPEISFQKLAYPSKKILLIFAIGCWLQLTCDDEFLSVQT